MSIQAIPYILILGVLFGTTMLASRFSVGQFAPMTYVGIRLALASIAHVLIFVFGGEKRTWPRGKELWWRSAVLGIFGTVIPMNFITTSLQFQSSGVTSMLVTLGPAVTVVFAHFFLEDETLNSRKIAGVLMALSGAMLMLALGESGLPDVSEANPVGYLLVFTAMVSSSAATIFARKTMGGFEPLQVASIRMWTAAAVTVPLSLIFFGFDLSGVNTQGWLATGWAALTGTFLAMMLSFYIIQRFGATASAMTGYVIPVVAGIGGALLLNEEITAGIVAAMALIFGGIVLINRHRRRPKEIVV